MLDKIQICEQVTPDLINWSFTENGAKTSGQFIKGQPEFEACQSLPVFTPLNMDEYSARLEEEEQAEKLLEKKQAERVEKMRGFVFKGVPCSVMEADQNGWEVVGRRIQTLLDRGETFRPIPFFMENGNYVLLETHQEWLDFVDAGWSARESILLGRLG